MMVAVSCSSTPLPPTTEDDRLLWLRLLRSPRIGPENFFRLMGEYSSAAAAIEALPERAAKRGIMDYAPCSEKNARMEYRAASREGARLVVIGEPDYPNAFHDLRSKPPLFWAVGNAKLLNIPAISIVGSRNASSLGLRMCSMLSRALGESGEIIVSGLARGIDTAAHEAALETGTITVEAGGLSQPYPASNRALAKKIGQKGLRISEAPWGAPPQARHFPARNRLIAALGRALIVVEAAERSGSLITAQDALDMGRDVMAVPGHPFDARAAGCNALIRDGAALIRNAGDVQALLGSALHSTFFNDPDEKLGAVSKEADHTTLKETPEKEGEISLENEILQQLNMHPIREDEVLSRLNAPVEVALGVIAELEIRGEVRRERGGMIARG